MLFSYSLVGDFMVDNVRCAHILVKTEQEAKREAQTPCQSKTTIDSAGANQQQLEHGFYE